MLESPQLSKARTKAGLGCPLPSAQSRSVLSPHPGRRPGDTDSQGGSLTYYGHLCDEDPPNGIGYPTGGKTGGLSGPEATAPGSGARGPGRPPASPLAALRQVRVLDNELDVLFGEFRDPHGGLVGVRHRDPLPGSRASRTARLRGHQQFVGGAPGASG